MHYTEAEIQLINTLDIAKYRLENKKKDKINIRKTGENFIGRFIENWDKAFHSLTDKGLIRFEEDEYFLTNSGNEELIKIQEIKSFWLYTYERYFDLSKNSKAHNRFCKKVYGHSFSQHGMADKYQLDKLIDVMELKGNDKVLDLGCGNGLIADYLQKKTSAFYTGIDFSEIAINYAKNNINNDKTTYQIMNMNNLQFKDNSFDAIISIDTLYFVDDFDKTINEIFRILKSGGTFGFFYGDEIEKDDEEIRKNLLPDNTPLAKKLIKNNIKYNYLDLTENDDRHWKDKVTVLEQLKDEFEKEQNHSLYNFRYDEAKEYSSYPIKNRCRYLYYFSNNKI